MRHAEASENHVGIAYVAASFFPEIFFGRNLFGRIVAHHFRASFETLSEANIPDGRRSQWHRESIGNCLCCGNSMIVRRRVALGNQRRSSAFLGLTQSVLEVVKYFKYFLRQKLLTDHDAIVDYVGKRYALPY